MPPAKKKKTAKKSTKKAPVSKKTASKKPASQSAGKKKDTKKIEDDRRAQMWVLRQEGIPIAEIARQCDCSARSVSREFDKDPARLAVLVQIQNETRSARWKQIENKSLKTLEQTISVIGSSFFTPTGRISRKEVTQEDYERLDFLRKMIGPLRMAADSATNKSQLLAGSPTQIVSGDGVGIGVDASNMSDDEAIQLAIANNMVEELPVALREKAEKMIKSMSGRQT